MATPPSRTSTPVADPFPLGLQRLVALSGVAFVVLLIVSIAISGSEPPDFNDPVEQWTTYATEHQDDARISALVFAFAGFEFLWFLGFLRGVLGSAELEVRGFVRGSHIAFAGGLLGIAGLLLSAFFTGVGLSHEDAAPDVIRLSNDLSGAAFIALGSVGFSTLLIASAVLILRTGALPRWTGWVGLVSGVAFLGQVLNLLTEDTDNAFGVLFPLAFLTFLVWVLACSITFFRRVGATAATAPPPPVV